MRIREYVGTLVGSRSQRGGKKATSFREERRRALARDSLAEDGACSWHIILEHVFFCPPDLWTRRILLF